jgi:hypothetical protein
MTPSRFGVAILLATLVFGQHTAAEATQLTLGMPYMKARDVLLSAGWSPTGYAEAGVSSGEKELDDALRSDFLKRGAPEVGACFGTGIGQCFGIWRKKSRLFVIESLQEYKPEVGPSVYFFYEVQLHGQSALGGVPNRQEWDPRSADVLSGTFPEGHPW